MVIEMVVAGPNRRGFLTGLMAASLMPQPTWADAGAPSYLSAAALADGSYVLCGIGANLEVLFQIPLPSRGHAAAAHPTRPEAVAFTRRPGTFAVVLDCRTGQAKATLESPQGRHFYGHGVFSKDGNWLYTTENDYERGQGCVGVWDANAGYRRAGEFPSGGIGPHDIKRLPESDMLVVANGGIDTHPDTGRTKLNIPTMKPNLAYLVDGVLSDLVELAPALHKNSIRHLAVSSAGEVAFGMQWQGDTAVRSLVGTHKLQRAAVLLQPEQDRIREMQGYIGSIAFSIDNKTIAVTSPRGGVVHSFDAISGAFLAACQLQDVGGIASSKTGFVVSSGSGILHRLEGQGSTIETRHQHAWDNHLVSIQL